MAASQIDIALSSSTSFLPLFKHPPSIYLLPMGGNGKRNMR
jgi:hypothetical protein